MTFYLLRRSALHTPQDRLAGTETRLADGSNIGDAPRCEACGQYIGMRVWLPPFHVHIETWGREFGDVAPLQSGSDLLVSDRFKRLYEKHHLTGLSGFEPVEVLRITQHRRLAGSPPPYFKASVCRSQTTIDQNASGLEWEVPADCAVCRLGKMVKRWKGIVVQPETWMGEDIFIVRGMPGEDFITSERFKEFCEREGVKNAVLVPAHTYGQDFYPWEKQSSP